MLKHHFSNSLIPFHPSNSDLINFTFFQRWILDFWSRPVVCMKSIFVNGYDITQIEAIDNWWTITPRKVGSNKKGECRAALLYIGRIRDRILCRKFPRKAIRRNQFEMPLKLRKTPLSMASCVQSFPRRYSVVIPVVVPVVIAVSTNFPFVIQNVL